MHFDEMGEISSRANPWLRTLVHDMNAFVIADDGYELWQCTGHDWIKIVTDDEIREQLISA